MLLTIPGSWLPSDLVLDRDCSLWLHVLLGRTASRLRSAETKKMNLEFRALLLHIGMLILDPLLVRVSASSAGCETLNEHVHTSSNGINSYPAVHNSDSLINMYRRVGPSPCQVTLSGAVTCEA